MKDMKDFLIKLGVVFVLLLVIYYITSPYQNCIRDEKVDYFTSDFCYDVTNW
jgi:hypothetical protein